MSEWIDITVLIDNDYVVYPGDKDIHYDNPKTIEQDGYNLKSFETSMHVGTHLDVKKHVFNHKEGIEVLDINKFIRKATVLKPIIENGIIRTSDIIQQYRKANKILLLNCDFSKKWNTPEYFSPPKFERDIVPFLIKNKIEIIGFDIPSPEYIDGDFLDMHRELLGNNILIIENLTNLDKLEEECDFIGLPLKMKGFDGSMLRCVAKNE